jgi:tetratricopeptide (TPR) repeat protein
MLSLMADHQLNGVHAGGYHLTNVLLHTASVILLFLILRRMTGALWRSAFVAAVFAIHPLRAESVAWVAERKDVLSAFFFMLTLGAYARYVLKPNSLARYLVVAAAFLLALLSKPTVVTLPFVLLLLDYWPLRRFEQPRKLSGLILEKIPLLALAAGACAMTVLAEAESIASNNNISMSSRLGNVLVSYAVYLRQMIWPDGLAVPYPYPRNGLPPWEVALAGALLAGLCAVAWAGRRRRPWLLMGWLWYLGMLTPMIGLVPVGGFAHADRFTYLPQIGIYVALTWLVAEWGAKWQAGRAAFAGVMAGALAVLMVCAWRQTGYWKSSEILWTHTLACTTGNYVAYNNLGDALDQKGRVDEAISHFQKALEIKPDYASACNNLGHALRQKGRVDEAIADYQKALEIKPDYAEAHNNLGNALLQKGRVDEAIDHFQKALQLKPADPAFQNNLAWLLATCPQASLRNGNKAVELARQANALAGGNNPIILHTLAAAFAEVGRFGDAVQSAQKAIELAQAAGQQDLAGQLNIELKRYQAGLPLGQ